MHVPFIPHTEDDVRHMLDTIGVESISALFDEIPDALRAAELDLPAGLSEMEVGRLMADRAAADGQPLCFLGAGAYEHHIPAAVWEIATRGEFYSAYTPYQAEASQGTLQVIYEYQTMMASLTGLDVSNASLYDGATALAEAVLMAVRLNRKLASRRVLIPRTVHPSYRKVVQTLVRHQGIVIEELDYHRESGCVDPEALGDPGEIAAVVIPQPNFFGVLEEVEALTDWAHARGAVAIAVVNPTALGILKPPGEWGGRGADIACGEGQPLGAPLSSGGPYYGFLTCKQAHVRQMPGRLVGRTVDLDGKPGFTLTLQAREQHIRRSKATSNICTNQGLVVTASTIYMSLLGAEGLEKVARACHANTHTLVQRLTELEGLTLRFARPRFHEAVLHLSDVPVGDLLRSMAAYNIVGGYPLQDDYPELGNAWLVCATETRTERDMDTYVEHVGRVLERRRQAACPTRPKM
jgi:glycine dehydrogenase subunit 1